jgi:hypothetical protein
MPWKNEEGSYLGSFVGSRIESSQLDFHHHALKRRPHFPRHLAECFRESLSIRRIYRVARNLVDNVVLAALTTGYGSIKAGEKDPTHSRCYWVSGDPGRPGKLVQGATGLSGAAEEDRLPDRIDRVARFRSTPPA